MKNLTIKRGLILLLSACILVSSCFVGVAAAAVKNESITLSASTKEVTQCPVVVNHYLSGDVNFDGVVNEGDAMLVLRHDAKLTTLSELQCKIGDVNTDAAVDFVDAAHILRYASPDCPEKAFNVTMGNMGDSPDNPMVVNGPYTISGTVSDVNDVRILAVNGSVVTINPDGTWSKTIALGAGYHAIAIYVRDIKGNTTSILRYVHCVPGPKMTVNHYLAGDVDMDGVVSLADAELVAKHEIGLLELSPLQVQIGDVYSDGELTIKDSVLIGRFAEPSCEEQTYEMVIDGAGESADNPMLVSDSYTVSGTILNANNIEGIYVNNSDFISIFLKHVMNIIGTDKSGTTCYKICSHFP